ncbi:unnamed protein product [Brassica oleracea var. botrytis]|uniref:(rape) hypothetical protein n=1 Tax=Brassica napus TaxID=3708 RepID=A0A816JMR4_BRANA|nr:unnamed protein product [Brassica napus]
MWDFSQFLSYSLNQKPLISKSQEYDHDDSHHDFYGVDGDSESSIENMKEEYGLLVWPCSVILADGNTDPDFVVLPFSR